MRKHAVLVAVLIFAATPALAQSALEYTQSYNQAFATGVPSGGGGVAHLLGSMDGVRDHDSMQKRLKDQQKQYQHHEIESDEQRHTEGDPVGHLFHWIGQQTTAAAQSPQPAPAPADRSTLPEPGPHASCTDEDRKIAAMAINEGYQSQSNCN